MVPKLAAILWPSVKYCLTEIDKLWKTFGRKTLKERLDAFKYFLIFLESFYWLRQDVRSSRSHNLRLFGPNSHRSLLGLSELSELSELIS